MTINLKHYSLMSIELKKTDDEDKKLDADYWNDGDIVANTLGIVGPLQYDADQIGNPDILDAVLYKQNLTALYEAGQYEPKPGIPIMPTVIAALVETDWYHSSSPEGEEWDTEYKTLSFFQANELHKALAAMAPQKAATQPAPA